MLILRNIFLIDDSISDQSGHCAFWDWIFEILIILFLNTIKLGYLVIIQQSLSLHMN